MLDQSLFKGIREPIVIHSGLAGLRGVMPMRWVPKAVCEAVNGLSVVMPAYTHQFCRTGVFDLKRSKPNTGKICEVFGGKRTRKPINSYKATFDLDCEQTTAWGDDSVMAWLYEQDATFVALGVSTIRSCSYFHRAEEIVQSPYRRYKTFKGMLYDDGEHLGSCEETLFVGPRKVQYDFKALKAIEVLNERKLIERRPRMEIIRVRDIVDVGVECLMEDPYALCYPTEKGRERIREYVESGKLEQEANSEADA